MSNRVWIPRVTVARRCGAKLLTAHRGGGIELSAQHEIACVDVISHPYVSRRLCRLIGLLWLASGEDVLAWEEACKEPPIREKPKLDDKLAEALKAS